MDSVAAVSQPRGRWFGYEIIHQFYGISGAVRVLPPLCLNKTLYS